MKLTYKIKIAIIYYFKKYLFKIFKKNIKVIINGQKIYVNPDHTLPIVQKLFPLYNLNLSRIVSFINSNISKNCRYIDVGANVGDTSLLMSQSSPDSKIACFEPNSDYFNLLSKNLQKNTQCELFKVYLGKRDESQFLKPVIERGTMQFDISNQNTINFISFDTWLEKNIEYKDSILIKIDTDGYDFDILHGAQNFLKNKKPILFIEYDSELYNIHNYDGLEEIKWLKSLGYKYSIIYDNYGILLSYLKLDDLESWKALISYIEGKKSSIQYYDILIFSENDFSLCQSFFESELNFYRKHNSKFLSK
jgi:FkbM family methyltransferase